MRHKLVAFILKNPPKAKKSRKSSKNQDDPAAANGDENGEDNSNEADGGDSDDELTRRIKAEAAELQDKAVLADAEWSVDTSAEAVKARVKALEGAMKNSLTIAEDEEEEGADDPYSALGLWIQDNHDTITAVSVYQKAEELGIEKKHKTAQIMVQAIFDENFVSQIPKFAPLFKKVCVILFSVSRFITSPDYCFGEGSEVVRKAPKGAPWRR
jgi:translation initiation factor 5